MKPKIAICLLVLLFVGPIIVSWLFVNSDIDWAAKGLSNHGQLIRPPIDLRGEAATNKLFEYAQLAPSHWALISLEEQICTVACRERLNKIKVIGSVMGSSADRLHTFALAPGLEASPSEDILVSKAASEFLIDSLKGRHPDLTLPQYVVIDWRQQLMMHFPPQAPSADIKKDLSKLLKASKIR